MIPEGVWLVTDKYGSQITVYVVEIDALRFVNAGAASGVEVDSGRAAFFVPSGSTLSEVRGW